MIVLRSIVLAAIVGAAGTAAAQTSDLPRRTDSYASNYGYQPQGQKNWTGAYAGAHLGGGWGKAGSVSTGGFVGGVQGGYNVQFDKVVVGGEADISASSVGNKSFNEKVRTNSLGSVRARAGYLVDPSVMVYGTGGLGFGNVSSQSMWGKSSETNSGWALGAGGEYMVHPNVTLRGEYLYYSLGKSDYMTNIGPVKIDNSTNVLRAGANYKF
jgi:outer membrane immunogenic protein